MYRLIQLLEYATYVGTTLINELSIHMVRAYFGLPEDSDGV